VTATSGRLSVAATEASLLEQLFDIHLRGKEQNELQPQQLMPARR
jgi:hypothetical protein